MDCNSCGSCIQTLEVLQANFTVADTDSVDLTLTGSSLTADVNIDPDPSNAISVSAAGLLVREHTSVVAEIAAGATITNLTAALDAIPVATLTTLDQDINILSVSNPSTSRSMNFMIQVGGRIRARYLTPFGSLGDTNTEVAYHQISLNGGVTWILEQNGTGGGRWNGTDFDLHWSEPGKGYIATVAPGGTLNISRRTVYSRTNTAGVGSAMSVLQTNTPGISVIGVTA